MYFEVQISPVNLILDFNFDSISSLNLLDFFNRVWESYYTVVLHVIYLRVPRLVPAVGSSESSPGAAHSAGPWPSNGWLAWSMVQQPCLAGCALYRFNVYYAVLYNSCRMQMDISLTHTYTLFPAFRTWFCARHMSFESESAHLDLTVQQLRLQVASIPAGKMCDNVISFRPKCTLVTPLGLCVLSLLCMLWWLKSPLTEKTRLKYIL